MGSHEYVMPQVPTRLWAVYCLCYICSSVGVMMPLRLFSFLFILPDAILIVWCLYHYSLPTVLVYLPPDETVHAGMEVSRHLL
jgi:hypothetical protein